MDFKQLCESYGIFRQVKREFYPKNIEFSPDFIDAVRGEYNRQKNHIEEDSGTSAPIRDHRNKFLKALNFHLRDIDHGIVKEMNQGEALKKEVALQKKALKAVKKEQPKVLKRNLGKK